MSRRMGEKLLTVEEFEQLPGATDYREELSRGKVVREPPPGPRHGSIVAKLAMLLNQHVIRNGLGRVFVESGFVLAEKPATVRGPDISFVAAARAGDRTPVHFYRFAPDLAIEVLSPANEASEINRKVKEYLHAGTRTVWVIDPRNEIVISYQFDGSARVCAPDDDLTGAEIIPGFRVTVAELFAD